MVDPDLKHLWLFYDDSYIDVVYTVENVVLTKIFQHCNSFLSIAKNRVDKTFIFFLCLLHFGMPLN